MPATITIASSAARRAPIATSPVMPTQFEKPQRPGEDGGDDADEE